MDMKAETNHLPELPGLILPHSIPASQASVPGAPCGGSAMVAVTACPGPHKKMLLPTVGVASVVSALSNKK